MVVIRTRPRAVSNSEVRQSDRISHTSRPRDGLGCSDEPAKDPGGLSARGSRERGPLTTFEVSNTERFLPAGVRLQVEIENTRSSKG